jgi:hypothetical protein
MYLCVGEPSPHNSKDVVVKTAIGPFKSHLEVMRYIADNNIDVRKCGVVTKLPDKYPAVVDLRANDT